MKFPDSPRWHAVWRWVRVPLLLIGVYLVLHQVLSMLSDDHGLDSPGGFGLPYLVVTGLVLILRVVLLVVVPACYAYRIVVWAVERLLRLRPVRDPQPEQTADRARS
ncbi:hypothetical protein [Nocardia sp. NBC_00511]|uniref:hypothetical protein n=1 Tax=Nocardia sp. NBC_00511 TaxID=2903591 RepID=UPI0030E13426